MSTADRKDYYRQYYQENREKLNNRAKQRASLKRKQVKDHFMLWFWINLEEWMIEVLDRYKELNNVELDPDIQKQLTQCEELGKFLTEALFQRSQNFNEEEINRLRSCYAGTPAPL